MCEVLHYVEMCGTSYFDFILYGYIKFVCITIHMKPEDSLTALNAMSFSANDKMHFLIGN